MTRKTEAKSLSSGKEVPAGKKDPSRAGKKEKRDKLSEIFHALRQDAEACAESDPEQILDKVRKRLDAEKKKPKKKKRTCRKMIAGPWVIRFALLALGLVLFLGMVLSAKKKEPASKPLRPDRTGAGPSYAEFIARPAVKSQQYRTADAFSSSVSPLESLFHGECFCVYDGIDGFLPAPPAIVSCRSSQLWTASSFRAPDLKAHLAELCGDLRIGGRKITVNGNVLVLSAEADARQAAVLVKQLAAWGLIPVSKSGPLPERYLYLGPGRTKTDLVITFLLKAQDGPGHLSREEKDLFLGRGNLPGGGR